jgi:hypothetical protein
VKANRTNAILIAIVAVAITVWLVWSKKPHEPAPAMQLAPAQEGAVIFIPHSNAPVVAANLSRMRSNALNLKLGGDFSGEEKEQLTNVFEMKLKPAAEKWFSVYSNRVPFNLAGLTMDKFVRRIGKDSNYRAYTFVVGDTTFGIQEFHGSTYVNYLASRRGVVAMNNVPKLSGPADLSMPISRDEVIELIQADSGVRFPPNEVTLTPTGESGSLMGGANVQVGKEVNDPNGRKFTTTSMDFSIVFGSDGKLAYYLRTP